MEATHRAAMFIVVVTVWAIPSLAQQSTTSETFHWDWHKSQELDWKRTIKKANIPAQEKADLLAAIKAQLEESDSVSPNPGDQLPDMEQTEIEVVQLDGNGPREVIAQATGPVLCSPTGNCTLWILRRDKDGFNVVLEGEAQTFTIQPTRTNGFHDVVLGMQRVRV